ncbi:high affinity immunoglobulin gamma Fc receptor I-like [Symphorus nematophorus]
MDALISLLGASVTSIRAVVEMVLGDSRIFSGENARLKCSVPDVRNSSWSYLWFRGPEQLLHRGEHLLLWKPHITESGKYYCQGVRDTAVGNIHTLKSLPVEINVDGGYAILQVPPRSSLVGDTLKVTCRVRGNPPLHEVILYKDGTEVMRQKGPHFYLPSLTLEDQGTYSCRASWDENRRTRSVISIDVPVQVLEVVSQPVLEIVVNKNQIPENMMKLICHHQYNAPAPAPPVHYYFYKNNNKLGTATSENHDLVIGAPGLYRCRVKVPQLDLVRWSEPKSFGQVTGPQTVMPPTIRSTDPRPIAPPVSFHPTAKPTAARPSPHQSTATPTFMQPTEVSTQSSPGSLLKTSQPAPSTLLSTVQSLNPSATPESNAITFEESGDMSGESGDMSGGSGDMSGESVVMSQDSLDTVIW